jgi:hypothetical protein
MIEHDQRIVGQPQQHAVQRDDLRPVGILGARRFIMHGRDRGQQLILAHGFLRQRRAGERHAFGDRLPIPARAILLVERNQFATRSGARRAAGVGQEHQREQAGNVAVAGQELVHLARQTDRLVRQVAALQLGPRTRRVAFVEDEIQHVQHRAQSLRALIGVRHAKRHARCLDALLCPTDALPDGRLRHEKRLRDLGRRESAHRAQRQRDGGGGRERRMTAHEQQGERVVGIGRRLAVHGGGNGDGAVVGHHRLTLPACDVAASVVGHASPSDMDQPAAGVIRDAEARPLTRRGHEGFLHGILGRREVTIPPDHRAEHLRRKVAQQTLDAKVRRR